VPSGPTRERSLTIADWLDAVTLQSGTRASMDNDHRDDPGEIRWLSYSQIAAVRQISRASAIRMCRKAGWRRQVNNQGVVTVAVPASYADRERASPGERPGESPGDSSALQGAVEALREANAALAEARITAESRVTALQAEVRHEAAERVRAEGKVSRLQAELADAQAAVKRLQGETAKLARKVNELAEAEAARKGRGRWRRLLEAWRRE
jgi:DNA repair exonuclease SbcCD ATPase subunit